MKTNNKVSIILPCYNCASTLPFTLESIKTQTYKNFELVIINDGSTDDSIHIITNFIKSVSFSVKLITRDNKGFLYSLEEGIDASQGDFIARIDGDDFWFPNHLESHMKAFEEDESLVLVGSEAYIIDQNGNYIGEYAVPHSYFDIIKFMHNDNPFIHSSVIFKRSAYKKTKGYMIGNDEKSKHIADYYLWFELSKQGKCINLDIITLCYRYNQNSMSRTIKKYNNYLARLSVMKEVNNFYKKYPLYSLYCQIKVLLRLIQTCLSIVWEKKPKMLV
ncbi:glycosyltransferase family 2 protein [Calditerrivibrio nitroreducens]|uniref:Glycosyl transferase family 2 n=1 Tax=Calditerrivibrio nitroreducens (strain DSM 19672 / NBRC 101217 / Yu37-1) TaxID=768670 RepID=E4TIK7_CALNY|nr:glycosyltransferase [Calditerrivibrio nitroreducens]ADR19055.1 glycosyl transferase family 2 [Calditerrivibrio nitroreducens DSM 19672]